MNIRITKLLIFISLLPLVGFAQNPVVQTNYTADPAPMVHEGTVYLYTSHDENQTVKNFFTMNDWLCYSTTDMVNWTDHGAVLSYKDFEWSRGDAWVGECISNLWHVKLNEDMISYDQEYGIVKEDLIIL
jgi:hypothetical protein